MGKREAGLPLMGLRLKVNLHPFFHPGEKALFTEPWVWLMSWKSFPNFRVTFSIPPLSEAGMYVTDRRVLLIFHLFRIVTMESSFYLDENAQTGGNDCLKEVTVGHSRLFGPYLQMISENPQKKWYRSTRARIRIFMRNPESLRRIITAAMETRESR